MTIHHKYQDLKDKNEKLKEVLKLEELSSKRWYTESKRLRNIIREAYDEIAKCDCKDSNGNHSHWLNPNLPKLEKLLKEGLKNNEV